MQKIINFIKELDILTIKWLYFNKIKCILDISFQREFNHSVNYRVKIYLKKGWMNYDLVL